MLMAMNIIMSSSILSIPVPGGHMYLNDIVIVTAAVLLDPFQAFLVGGVGAFIGDLLFYPAPMFVSLAVHGIQALVISLFNFLPGVKESKAGTKEKKEVVKPALEKTAEAVKAAASDDSEIQAVIAAAIAAYAEETGQDTSGYFVRKIVRRRRS